MSQQTEGRTKTFTAGAAIGQWILVKLSSGKLAVAGLGEEFLGVIEEAAFADGDLRSVVLRSSEGTIKCVASGAFSAGAVVYGRAAGKVDDISTTSALRVGIALEAATAANDVIEVLPSK
jgi:hypothetical protein